MTIETITYLLHQYIYDRVNDSNNSNDGRDIKHLQGRLQKSGRKRPFTTGTKEGRNTTEKNIKITVAVKEEHLTGSDNMCAQQKQPNAGIARKEDTTRRCADYQKEYYT